MKLCRCKLDKVCLKIVLAVIIYWNIFPSSNEQINTNLQGSPLIGFFYSIICFCHYFTLNVSIKTRFKMKPIHILIKSPNIIFIMVVITLICSILVTVTICRFWYGCLLFQKYPKPLVYRYSPEKTFKTFSVTRNLSCHRPFFTVDHIFQTISRFFLSPGWSSNRKWYN